MGIIRIIKFSLVFIILILVVFFLVKIGNSWFGENSNEKNISTHSLVVEKMEELGKLELVKVHVKDVVEHTVERPWYLGGDTRILLVVGGEAVGCIDLKKISKEDISGKDTLTITLPQPEVCYFKVNHSESKVYHVETLHEGSKITAEAFRQAEKQIEKAALQTGILAETQQNAEKVLKPLLEAISGKKVILRFKTELHTPEKN